MKAEVRRMVDRVAKARGLTPGEKAIAVERLEKASESALDRLELAKELGSREGVRGGRYGGPASDLMRITLAGWSLEGAGDADVWGHDATFEGDEEEADPANQQVELALARSALARSEAQGASHAHVATSLRASIAGLEAAQLRAGSEE